MIENTGKNLSSSSENEHQPKEVLRGRLVLVDDDLNIRTLLAAYLQRQGFELKLFSSATEALKELENNSLNADLVITDLKMPEMDGLEFVSRLKQKRPSLPVLLVTAFGSIETAIEAIKRGAFDYIVKPFKFDAMTIALERALKFKRLAEENVLLKQEIRGANIEFGIVGKSEPIRRVIHLIKRVASTDANVLLTGESGTGKEVVARAIHNSSNRSEGPFVAINCAAIPESLLESEFFGHAKGSFTGANQRRLGLFEEARKGTIFLDEIGEMDLGLQAKLLRVIQERKVKPVGENIYRDIDVRIISGTNRDLRKQVKEGKFREDFYYRLNVVPIDLPPLRERKEDIPLLAIHFLQKYSQMHNPKITGFTKAAMSKLMSLAWPGNVRELENVVERAVIFSEKNTIDEKDISTITENSIDSEEFLKKQTSNQILTLKELERRYIDFVLGEMGGQKDKTAQVLGIDRKTLYRKENKNNLKKMKVPNQAAN